MKCSNHMYGVIIWYKLFYVYCVFFPYPRDRTGISSRFRTKSRKASKLSRFLDRKYQQYISRFSVGLIQVRLILRESTPHSLGLGQCYILCIVGLDDEKSSEKDLEIFTSNSLCTSISRFSLNTMPDFSYQK